MLDSCESFDEICEIEAIVRSAADYVVVSNDLRPRILEAARLSSGEKRARRRIRHTGLIAALLAWLLAASIDRMPTAENLQRLTLIATGTCSVSSGDGSVSSGNGAWALVDAYSELRSRRAAALHLAF